MVREGNKYIQLIRIVFFHKFFCVYVGAKLRVLGKLKVLVLGVKGLLVIG